MSKGLSYREAGVDIDAGDALVEAIKPFVKRTLRPEVLGGIGGFGGLCSIPEKYKKPVLVSGTDGVGTKLKLAFAYKRHGTVGIDLVAMNANDVLVQGAEPLFFLDYFACGKLDTKVAESVIRGIAKGCEQAGCALIGGETAEMPGLYAKGDFDLAGFAVGAVERGAVLPRMADMRGGDVLIGVASSGVHSNGYSLVRKVVTMTGASLSSPAGFTGSTTLGDALLTPTRLYVKSALAAIRAGGVKGLAHITGGGVTENLPRVLPQTLDAEIDLSSWELPPVFRWLSREAGLPPSEMLRTFNCGVGLIVVADAARASEVVSSFNAAGESAFAIGKLVPAKSSEPAVRYIGTLRGA
jgi:phosphoribosylformylglycinamidine cyclo-ligase